MFEVALYGTHPEVADEAWVTETYKSYEDALYAYNNPEKVFEDYELEGVRFLQLQKNCPYEGIEDYGVRELEGFELSIEGLDDDFNEDYFPDFDLNF